MPIPAGPSSTVAEWAPDLVAVAKYVPKRTVVGAVQGYGDPQNTFTALTHPTADQVTLLIGDAVAWVLSRANPLDATLWAQATATAALRAAWAVELSYPDTPDDINTAAALLAAANGARDDLAHLNLTITGDDPGIFEVVPYWSFMPPPTYGDYPPY